MRVLFVSGESVGGAPASTIELGRQLALRGHQVDVLLGDRPGPDSIFQRAVNVTIKCERVPAVHRLLRRALRRIGARTETLAPDREGEPARFLARVPENAYRALLASVPDVVVANSLPRVALRWMMDDLRRLDVPLVLYLREAHAISHLTISKVVPAAIVANSLDLQRQATELGLHCEFIPSVIDLASSTTSTSRTTAVMVNPIRENHPDRIVKMASLRPDIPFVLQESWPLDERESDALRSMIEPIANVELRPRTANPADVYRDARVLIAPYPTGRPRVVLEAQANAIPVIALDQPALAEVVGPGGVLVPTDADEAQWMHALQTIWDDRERYDDLVEACRTWASRDEIGPASIAARFEAVLERVAGGDGS
jgi:glycosyltransferase involved in cell wall biosynthesis